MTHGGASSGVITLLLGVSMNDILSDEGQATKVVWVESRQWVRLDHFGRKGGNLGPESCPRMRCGSSDG